jgi:putative transposase
MFGIIEHSVQGGRDMKRSRYSEEQIVGILKEAEAGISVAELCRKYGMSDATYYNWKAKYDGMMTSDLKKLRQYENENRKLKQMVAEQALDIRALKEVVSKNF